MEVRTVPSFGIPLDVKMVKVIEVLVLIIYTEPKPGVCVNFRLEFTTSWDSKVQKY